MARCQEGAAHPKEPIRSTAGQSRRGYERFEPRKPSADWPTNADRLLSLRGKRLAEWLPESDVLGFEDRWVLLRRPGTGTLPAGIAARRSA